MPSGDVRQVTVALGGSLPAISPTGRPRRCMASRQAPARSAGG